jgi:hypothetical protein
MQNRKSLSLSFKYHLVTSIQNRKSLSFSNIIW